nr:Z1 domain-containing protein [Corynebacterium mendelii]
MLDKPDGYRGAEWFHDRLNFTDDDEEPTIDNCRSEAFIRYLAEELVVDEENTSEAQLQAEKEAFFEEHRCELQRALDMFVLTGAVKKYREEKDPELSFKHHTMLVHEGVDTHLHDETTRILRELWTTRGYGAGLPIPQMQELFEKDVLPVMKAGDGSWSEDWPVPESWQELQPYIIKAYEEITTDTSESGGSPILQINTGDNSDEMPNFESGKVWKVLVGGAKLSRGYTVEGLTVSYFRRRTVSADTLMQTGRWFGFRKGYQDLVRLYAPETLVDAFEAAMVDEETFRYNARVYAGFGEGALTPADLPPLVQQSLPWLAPTAREKRFNVYPVSAACGPETKEFNGIPARSNRQALADNFTGVAQPLLQTLSADIAKLAFFREEGAKNGKLRYSTGQIQAHCGLMSSSDFVDLLGKMQWTTEGSFKENVVNPRLEYLRNLLGRGSHANPDASDFSEIVVLLPHLKNNPKMIDVPGVDFKVPLVQRSRRVGRADITGGDRKLMYVAQNIAAGNDCRELGSEDAEKMGITLPQYSDEPEPFPMTPERMNNRGAVIVTLFDDRDPEILKQMKDSGTWTVPDFTAGEVGLALAVNSPLEPIKGFEDVIELRVIKRNADNTYDATIDVRDVPANV